jgi:hypothetical protein
MPNKAQAHGWTKNVLRKFENESQANHWIWGFFRRWRFSLRPLSAAFNQASWNSLLALMIRSRWFIHLELTSKKGISGSARITSNKLFQSREKQILSCILKFSSVRSAPLWNRILIDSKKLLRNVLRGWSTFVWELDASHKNRSTFVGFEHQSSGSNSQWHVPLKAFICTWMESVSLF